MSRLPLLGARRGSTRFRRVGTRMIVAMSGPASPEDAIRELQQISDAALASLSMDELLRELLERIAAILGSDTAAFLLLDEVSGDLVAQAAKGIEEEVEQGVRIPVGRGFAGRIAAQRRPVAIEDVDHADILNPILREKGIRSLLGVPLLVEGRVIGVLHVGSLTRRHLRRAATATCSSSPPTAPRSRSSTPACTRSGTSSRRCSTRCCPAALPVIPGHPAHRDLSPGGGRRARGRRLVRRVRARAGGRSRS